MSIRDDIHYLCIGEHGNPHKILGKHEENNKILIRAFLPDDKKAWVIIEEGDDKDNIFEMEKVHQNGIFEISFEKSKKIFRYRIRTLSNQNEYKEFYDPYAFQKPILTDYDLYLMAEGTHYKNYEKLGSHIIEVDGIKGVHFCVWAPNAKRVSVVGDFNHWNGIRHPMRMLGNSGIWEIFIPGLDEGTLYKFEILSKYDNYKEQKSDPFAFFFEVRPKSAGIVYNIDNKYQWQDAKWMDNRRSKNWFSSPIAIYEVHLGSWMLNKEQGKRFLTYRELADKLIPYVKELGFTHIELLPITEHPLDASWGYQTIGYYAPTSRYGKPEDFMYFVDKCHQNDIAVILDWVPAHFPKDAHGLRFFDGTCLYEHQDPRKGEFKEWGTLSFNYGRKEVANFLISNALFWFEKYHIDGLRVDAVASMLYLDYGRQPGEWIPNIYGGNENLEAIDFIKRLNEVVHKYHSGILMIAEESTAWPSVTRPTYLGGLGFSMKWNMGWMHDTLLYFSKDPIFRKYHTNNLTFSLFYAFSENFILPLSHDEVVHMKKSMLDKMPGDVWQKFANLRALYGYMYGHPGKKLLFMGSEFGQWNEWNFDDELQWYLLQEEPHRKLQHFVRDLNHLYKSEPALFEVDYDPSGFEWIDFSDAEKSIISFIRKAKNPDNFLIFVFNLTPVPRYNYRIGVPKKCFYQELLNSDSHIYWGSNMGNGGGVNAENFQWHGRPFSINLTLPPLSVLILKPIE